MTRLLLLPGDGIGPEIVAATRQVIEAADRRFALGLTLATAEIGFAAQETTGSTMPDAVLDEARQSDGIVMGPVSHNAYPPLADGGVNPSAILRTGLDLFANIRPARTRPGLPGPLGRPIDLVIFRENTEGFYADRNMASGPGEMLADPDMALALRKITRRASARIADAAFAEASKRPARHVTAVHKANVLRLSDGLFLEETRRAAAANPEITYDEVLVDAMAAHLVRSPERFDVIVTTNMFGDILSDLASEISGGLGLAASLNEGPRHAMAQAQHGSAPDLAGRDIANPVALIGSTALLFDWIGRRTGQETFRAAASSIEDAIDAALTDPATRTPDLGGTGTTSGMARIIARATQESMQ
ncbi:isocitrate/isopropylmalate dehydrogenase family protein [Ovoidimarina sediminis]|uniref:isocitrate/isopropylmalate dehydrogenase family protein n=1 Tax=Ovoidimarina sediminis TaxID=3079856 RepID=UPI00290B282B|nr:isocitrate/isopropylmalate dehydrogenase family protein [Rhodophyticola sp. MJ-SS7]MDU8945424.1 isocitrate/isopropylmalate dehydrogenase family protein [Rhodophyticola sp. MJ-SS7]